MPGRAVYDRLRGGFWPADGDDIGQICSGDDNRRRQPEGFERLAEALEAIDLDLQRADAAAERGR